VETAIRAKSPLAILAILLSAVVLGVFAGLKAGAVPPLPAKLVLGVTIPMVFATFLAAIGPAPRVREAGFGPGWRPAEEVRTTDDLRDSEVERVRAWRSARLSALGIGDEIATVLAKNPVFSVHELERLVDAGCPLGTALRILWPA
jgi:hypothetical protein